MKKSLSPKIHFFLRIKAKNGFRRNDATYNLYHQGVIGVRQQTDGQMLRYGRWKRMGQGNTGGHAPRVPKSNGEKAKEAGVYPF